MAVNLSSFGLPPGGASNDMNRKIINPRTYVAVRTSSPPKMDGRLDDGAWQAAPWSEDLVDIEGDRKPKPTWRTRFKMTWDDKCLYIGAEIEEPHVCATLKERDCVIFQDNDFEVFIDPDADCHEYYELELNAFGTFWDLLLTKPYKDGGSPVNNWDAKGIVVKVHVKGTINDPSDTDEGWTVEIAYPWSALKECAKRNAPPKDGDQWRINFSRVEWDVTVEKGKYKKVPGRPEHNWVWSPQGVIDMHRPERWGIVQFSEKKVAFRPDPTLDARDALIQVYYAQKEFQAKTRRYAKDVAELGLDLPVKLYTTPNLFEAVCGNVRINQESRFWLD